MKNNPRPSVPTAQTTTAGASNSLAKGMTSSEFPLQVGNFIQPMQMPAALSNLDEQKKRYDDDDQVPPCDGLKSIQISDPVNLADKPADHVAKHMRTNRVNMKKKALASEAASCQEMILNVKNYLGNLDLNLELLKDKKKDLEEELEVFALLYAKLYLKHKEARRAGAKAELLCFRTAKKILTMQGLEEVLNTNPEILKDNWILSSLKTPKEIEKHLSDVETRENFLESMCREGTKSTLRELWNQLEMEESHLVDVNKPQENTKACIMSLSKQLALQTSEMNQKDDILADSRSLLSKITHYGAAVEPLCRTG